MNFKKSKTMVNNSNEEILKSKINSCAKCDKRISASAMLSTKCSLWVHGRCAKIKESEFNCSKSLFVKDVLR